jgi:multidrug efflux pump subunit AcrA (membrane-fusion protein)
MMTDVIRFRRAWALAALLLMSACGGGKGAPADSAEAVEQHHDEEKATRVELTEAAATAAGIRTLEVAVATAATLAGAIDVPGQVESDPSRVALVSSRAAGRLDRLGAVIGERVAEGQVVAWVQSTAYLTAQHDLLQTVRRESAVAGTADTAGARALRSAAEARLRLYGISDSLIATLRAGREPEPLLPVTAPFAGSLVEAMSLAGAAVEAGTPIFRLIDLSELDVAADVPEAQLPALRIGQSAQVTLPSYPDVRLTGTIERIKDELDPETRTIEALIHVRNPRRILRPGMFARVQIGGTAPANASTTAIAVPSSAILSEGDQRYVFVETSALVFERREIRLGASDARFGGVSNREVVVEEGLAAGDRVVVQGAFILKSELAKAGLGDDH